MGDSQKIGNRPQRNAAEILLNARKYVEYFFAKSNISVLEAKGMPHLHATIKLDYDEEFRAFKVINQSKAKPLKWIEIDAALEEYYAVQVIEERKRVVEGLVCQKENLSPLKEFVMAATGGNSELDVAVLAHWCWQVKRRAFNKKVVWHVMPVLYGAQGSGKSMAIKRLLSPIQSLYSEMALDSLADDRLYKGFSEYLVLFFDELQQIKKANIETLKHQISTDINSYRPMRTNELVTVPMRASCIGASNKPLSDSFSDSTGMRRFYEMETVPEFPIDAINGIDYAALWKGVDESKEEGYLTNELRKQLTKMQEALVDKEPIDEFIKDLRLQITGPDGSKEVTMEELYNAYVIYCGKWGLHTTSAQWVTKKLKARKFVTYEQNHCRYFRISANSLVGKKGIEAVK